MSETNNEPITNLQVAEQPSKGTLSLASELLLAKAKKAVLSRLESVQAQHDAFVKRCDEWDKLYKGENPNQLKDTLAQVATKIGFNSVEDWVATMMDAHFSADPPFAVKSKRGKDDAELLQRITKVLWQNAKETHIEENSERIFRSGVKYGTFTAKTSHVVEEDLGFKIISQPKTINVAGAKIPIPFLNENKAIEEIRIEDRVPLQPVDIRNLYFRYNKKSWVIERIQSSWSLIEKQAEAGMYGNLEAAKKTSIGEDDPLKTLKQENKTQDIPETLAIDRDLELYEGHHIPITFDAEDGIPELVGQKMLCLVALANKSEVIRILPEDTKEPPYIISPFIPVEGSELGIGILQMIEPLVKELNTRRNQSLDANTFGLYCMVVANMRYIKKKEQLKIRPNGAIELKNVPTGARVEDIVSFVRPPVEFVQIANGLIDRLNAEIVTTTRLKGVSSGEKIAPNPSATEMTSIMKEALKSIKLIFRRIDRNIFEEYYQRTYIYFVLNRQKSWIIATTRTQVNPQTGAPMEIPAWDEITPEQIYSDGVEIQILGTTHMEDEIVIRHQNMQLLDIAAKYGSLPIKNTLGKDVRPDFYKLLNDVYYTFKKEDVEELWEEIPPPPPPPPPVPEPPKISFSFKGEDLMNQIVLNILAMNGIKLPAMPGGQGIGGNPGEPVMQGGPMNLNMQTPVPNMANVIRGATNPRAIREPIGGIASNDF